MIDLGRNGQIRFNQRRDFSDGMEHGRMIASAETPADFWKRSIRQSLTKKHCDLARSNYIGGPHCGKHVRQSAPK
jgi:hypothetical protein